jgi:fructose-1,6-bisphosphatase/inositol monophosphatase family enzyme
MRVYNERMTVLRSASGDDTRRLTFQEIDTSLAAISDVFIQFRPVVLEQAGKSAYTTKAHDGSPVTDIDVKIEEAVLAELARRFPDTPVFGEESGYGGELPSAFWLIDPLDGTKSFIAGIPAFTHMAVLIQDSEAAASLIYNPSSNVTYTARKGGGAYKNGTRLELGAMPLPHEALSKERFFEPLNAFLQPEHIICKETPSGGGYGFTLVADGSAAARFNLHSGGYTHDYAPGALLVREAGGSIIPVLDEVYTYETRSFVACHPALEPLVREHLPLLRELDS